MEALNDRIKTPGIEVKEGLSFSKMTTMGTGGPARFVVDLTTFRQASGCLSLLQKESVPWMVLGKGANLVVSSDGFDGAVLRLKGIFEKIWIHGKGLAAGGGAQLHHVARRSAQEGLGGMERLAGFPSTLGGAVVMNAGCYGQEIGKTLSRAIVIQPDGRIRCYKREKVSFSYRSSSLARAGVVGLALFDLTPFEKGTLQSSMEEVIQQRREILPPGRHSGSIFKNPPGRKAWKLIRECGLAGHNRGGAKLSEHHTNVILNTGSATGEDIYALIKEIREVVKNKFDLLLEPEVKLIGFPPLPEL